MIKPKTHLLFFALFMLAYLFPIEISFMQETRYSYHLNLFRFSVMIAAVMIFKELFRSKIYLLPIAYAIVLMATLGLLFSLLTEIVHFSFELHKYVFPWMFLQLQTVITEGILFFIIIPHLFKRFLGLKNDMIYVAIFAIAHGITLFLPIIFLVGLFYMKVLRAYGFNTHLLVHFFFNLTQILFFTLP